MIQFPTPELTTRGISPFERHFSSVMAKHYAERVKVYPHKHWLKNTMKYYQQVLLTASITTYDTGE